MVNHRHIVLLGVCLAICVLSDPNSQAIAREAVFVQAQFAEAQLGANIDFAQQIRAQYEPTVKVELSFAIRSCKLEGDERKVLIDAGNKWLDEYVKKVGNPHQNQRGIRVFNGAIAQGNIESDPRLAIRKGIEGVCKKVMKPEQFVVYEKECEQRERFYREAIAAILVSRMDEKLALSAEQRKKLADSFVEKWNAQWAPPLEMFMYNNEYWPSIPDKVVSPHLTASQWEIWTRITKNAPNVHFGVNLGNEGQMIDDVEFDRKEEKAEKKPPQADGVLQFDP